MELGQDLKSHCNHLKAICTYVCETFDGCFSLRSVPFISQRHCAGINQSSVHYSPEMKFWNINPSILSLKIWV